jgi:hypothetical protein
MSDEVEGIGRCRRLGRREEDRGCAEDGTAETDRIPRSLRLLDEARPHERVTDLERLRLHEAPEAVVGEARVGTRPGGRPVHEVLEPRARAAHVDHPGGAVPGTVLVGQGALREVVDAAVGPLAADLLGGPSVRAAARS